MKNFKFLSSLALAGILTTGVMSSSFAADSATTPWGNFKKGTLADNKDNLATFILNDKSDRISVNDLSENYNLTSIDGLKVYGEDYET